MVLEPAARVDYQRLTCTQRDSLNAVLWWLADPMWTEHGNERWVAHMARTVEVKLHGALNRDERYSWQRAIGGDAMAEMIVRYGWPT